MANKFNEDQRIGQVVIDFPKSTEIFMKYNIDFCCGGDRSVGLAVKEDNPKVDVKTILDEVNDAFENYIDEDFKKIDWDKKSMGELLDYIENTHHSFMKKILPLTEEVILKIFKVHFDHDKDLLTEVYRLFALLKLDINIHLIKEEEELFPAIRRYEQSNDKAILKEVIKMLEDTEHEHDAAGDILKNLRKITNNYTLPEYGCATFKVAYDKLQEIESDLFHHIHLENNILFYKLKAEE